MDRFVLVTAGGASRHTLAELIGSPIADERLVGGFKVPGLQRRPSKHLSGLAQACTWRRGSALAPSTASTLVLSSCKEAEEGINSVKPS